MRTGQDRIQHKTTPDHRTYHHPSLYVTEPTKRTNGGIWIASAVLVIGGGIAGVQTALDIADCGREVYILERTPSLGGRMAQLDKTFPTNDCSICILSPKLVAAKRHPNITLLTYGELTAIRGEPGAFTVTIHRQPRYVEEEKCVGCGACAENCPQILPNEFDMGLASRKAIYRPFPQAIPSTFVIDQDACLGHEPIICGQCARRCERGAINYDMDHEIIEIDIGAVVVGTGFDQYLPTDITEYGYRSYEDVVTALEFERILNASGPTNGHVICPSDHTVPRKIVFIQCVGSRDVNHYEYCSSVCCMYAIKEAILARDHIMRSLADDGAAGEDIELTILYMDLRAYGKNFEQYYQRAKNEYGIRFVRGRAASVRRTDDGALAVTVEDTDRSALDDLEADLVVLASALIPSEGTDELAAVLDIDRDVRGFFCHPFGDPVCSTRAGVFLTGFADGPKDIPGSVASASAAAVRAYGCGMRETSDGERENIFYEAVHPREIDSELEAHRNGKASVPRTGTRPRRSAAGEGEDAPTLARSPVATAEPRIGVFVCHCGTNIGSVIDVRALVKYVRDLDHVVHATRSLFTCSDNALADIKTAIVEEDLNRVIVAACTPRTHEPIFRNTCEEAELNPYLFDLVNIRDQCSWVHSNEPERALAKAKDLIRMGVARGARLAPLEQRELDITQAAVVVGGGPAGIEAALSIGAAGYPVTLIEREEELGGMLRQLSQLSPVNEDAASFLARKMAALAAAGVTILTGETVEEIGGFVGNFSVTVASGMELTAGAIILATGAETAEPDIYSLGSDDRVMTLDALERQLAASDNDADLNLALDTDEGAAEWVFVLCAGSRVDENPSCSRICCQVAISRALALRERGDEVSILYRDIRTYHSSAEQLYKDAMAAGVRFMRYDRDAPPIFDRSDGSLRFTETTLEEELVLAPDRLVLATPMEPADSAAYFQERLKVPSDARGFYLEAHPKLAPVDTTVAGVYIAGCAQGPKFIEESVIQGAAAAGRVLTTITHERTDLEGSIAVVDETRCWGCGNCVDICAFHAPELVQRVEAVEPMREGAPVEERTRLVSIIQPAMCKGCGVCAARCPSGAITALHFTSDQIMAMLEAYGSRGGCHRNREEVPL